MPFVQAAPSAFIGALTQKSTRPPPTQAPQPSHTKELPPSGALTLAPSLVRSVRFTFVTDNRLGDARRQHCMP